MSLSRLHHKRMLWTPGFLVLWLLAWSVALADPCVLQLPTVGHTPAELHESTQRAHLHSRGHGHAQTVAHAHELADQAPHDHSECDHALEHSGESALPSQADQNRSISLAFLFIAFVIPLPALQPVKQLTANDRDPPSPPLPVYLNTARLRI